MFLNLFDQAIKNPFNKKARAEHDAKPKSSFFEEKPNKVSDPLKRNRDGEITGSMSLLLKSDRCINSSQIRSFRYAHR